MIPISIFQMTWLSPQRWLNFKINSILALERLALVSIWPHPPSSRTLYIHWSTPLRSTRPPTGRPLNLYFRPKSKSESNFVFIIFLRTKFCFFSFFQKWVISFWSYQKHVILVEKKCLILTMLSKIAIIFKNESFYAKKNIPKVSQWLIALSRSNKQLNIVFSVLRHV